MAFTDLKSDAKMGDVRTTLNENFGRALEKPKGTDAGILFYDGKGVVSIAVASTDYIAPDTTNDTTTLDILEAEEINAPEATIDSLTATKNAYLGATTITGETTLGAILKGGDATFTGTVTTTGTLKPTETDINGGTISLTNATLGGNISSFNLTIGTIGFNVDTTSTNTLTMGGTLKASTLEATEGTFIDLTAKTLNLGDGKIVFDKDFKLTFDAPVMVNSTMKTDRTLSLDSEPQYRPIALGTAKPDSLQKGQIFIVM